MKIQEKCLPCIVNQTIKVADMVGLQDKNTLLQKVFTYLGGVDFDTSSTPELIGQVFRLLKQETGNADPYYDTRRHYNQLFLNRIPEYEQLIGQSSDPFREAVKYSILGNVIDFNPIHNLELSDMEAFLQKNIQEPLAIDETEAMIRDIKQAKKVLYLGDNCGEICFDRILVEQIKVLHPECDVYFATRGAAVVNDSIEEDAYFIGMDQYASIVSNGDDSLGTVLHRTLPAFQRLYEEADIVIAKGQANYECLSQEHKNIYFLLMTKCEVIAQDVGVAQGKMICKRAKY